MIIIRSTSILLSKYAHANPKDAMKDKVIGYRTEFPQYAQLGGWCELRLSLFWR